MNNEELKVATRYQDEHGRAARQRKAAEREKIRALRTSAQQLVVLDKRLGKGVGARKERKRLILAMLGDDDMSIALRASDALAEKWTNKL